VKQKRYWLRGGIVLTIIYLLAVVWRFSIKGEGHPPAFIYAFIPALPFWFILAPLGNYIPQTTGFILLGIFCAVEMFALGAYAGFVSSRFKNQNVTIRRRAQVTFIGAVVGFLVGVVLSTAANLVRTTLVYSIATLGIGSGYGELLLIQIIITWVIIGGFLCWLYARKKYK
jgi:hypothetical protein